MRVLIMMLKNIIENTYHPIFYMESPLPGGNSKLIRFKSKGHRTTGFRCRKDAVESIQSEIVDKLPEYLIIKELDVDLEWDGKDMPIDHQLRDYDKIVKGINHEKEIHI